MKNVNLEAVQLPTSDFKSVKAGGYVGKISLVYDTSDKEYLWIELDIAEGENAGYYKDLYDAKGFWGLVDMRSYKENALPFFKAFITAVQESNPGFKFDNDETKLKDKLVGMVLGEEEYEKNDGTIGTKLRLKKYTSIDKIRNGDFTVPPKKTINKPVAWDNNTDDLPFTFD